MSKWSPILCVHSHNAWSIFSLKANTWVWQCLNSWTVLSDCFQTSCNQSQEIYPKLQNHYWSPIAMWANSLSNWTALICKRQEQFKSVTSWMLLSKTHLSKQMHWNTMGWGNSVKWAEAMGESMFLSDAQFKTAKCTIFSWLLVPSNTHSKRNHGYIKNSTLHTK